MKALREPPLSSTGGSRADVGAASDDLVLGEGTERYSATLDDF